MAPTPMKAVCDRRPRTPWGFTLIEMVIVLAIVSIVTAIALPTFNEYVRRSHRAEARTGLLQAAHWLERAATANGIYPDGDLPDTLAKVPGGRYLIERTKPSDAKDAATRFELTATPQAAQSSDRCGIFTLTQAGERGLRANTASVADCWNR
ncbi:type IV pilin protein [Variovorax sp. J22R133]|uniref:type IV pilin protein n=1 Tax=Variovorax brevis TaxID=3053503 RepID=UPI002575DC88|nr:type IV pilin protein [Variovorax sp. J22R133]MDM0112681.1 type IV pilin protein [Variovorax sp. J22R133]